LLGYGNISSMKIDPQNKMFRYWFVLYAVFSCTSLFAVEVKDLYSAKVPIASQSKKDRVQALRQAMRSILVKVGGQNTVLTNPLIKTEVRRADRFVSNYRYERVAEQNYLIAEFQSSKINNLFVSANLPIWGSLRPQVIIWLVDENGLSRRLVAESSTSDLPAIINSFSIRRGLPVTLPLMDLTDANLIATSDVWGRFAEPIYSASLRYLADVVVTVRISDTSLVPTEMLNDNCQLLCQKVYVLDWSFIAKTNGELVQEFSENYQGINVETLLVTALSEVTDKIYQAYALSTDTNKEFFIDVANIDSLATYVQVSDFLHSLTSVRSVKLVSAIGSSRRFSLSLLGSQQAFLASLKLDKALRQYLDPLALVELDKVPVFYWGKS